MRLRILNKPPLLQKYSGPMLSCSVIPENHSGSLQQNKQIQEDASVFYVIKIIGKLAPGILCRGAIGIIDLRPASNSRPHPMAFGIVWNGLGQLSYEEGPLRAGPDETHIPAQYVQDLRQLVNPEFSNNRPHPDDARIAFRGPVRTSVRLGIHPHAAELHDGKNEAVQAYPYLTIEDWARALEPDQARRHHEEG